MNVLVTRINQDISKINELSRLTNNRIRILRTSGNPVNRIEVELNFSTVHSGDYPAKRQNLTIATIELLTRYPFIAPKVSFNPTVFHPNVYSSGLVCLGSKWMPTEFLDLLVKRLVQILAFDPVVTNVNSPANWEAANWYTKMVRTNPRLFPTENLNAIFSPAPVTPRITFREFN